MHSTNIEVPHTAFEQKACAFAICKIDDALATIEAAGTRHEGIFDGCLDCLLGLENIDQLPLAARMSIVQFLSVLQREPCQESPDQAQSAVASLSESEAVQFVAGLRQLRLKLMQSHPVLVQPETAHRRTEYLKSSLT